MANYANLEAFIQSKVYENANNEITGQGLQDTLLEMVKELGKSGFICQGVASTSTTPPVSSDSNIFYFAEGAGTYTNFGGLVVGVGELALFFWNGSTWDKESCNIVEIIDNLTTNDSTKALSAKQGKVLNDALQAIRQTFDSMDILDNVAGSAVGLLNPIAENAEFAFQKSGSKGDGAALINSIKGKTLAWNQKISTNISDWIQVSNLSISNGVFSATEAAEISYVETYCGVANIIAGHKYYCSVNILSLSNCSGIRFSETDNSSWINESTVGRYSAVKTALYSSVFRYVATQLSSGTWGYSFEDLIFTDLTLLYGNSINGMTDAQILAKYEREYPGYHDYNAGELKSNDAQSIVTEGRNQWDEEWENGFWSGGVLVADSRFFASKNKIPVFPNTIYYLTTPTPLSINTFLADGTYKDTLGGTFANATLTTGADVHYITFNNVYSNVYTTYNHDICINLSDASFNGQYEPYWKNTLELNIKTLTGKKDGQGASVTIFPDGAGGVGSVYDELHKAVAYKRCGIRAYQAGDESDSSVITDGTNTIYVLATPETYVLDTPLKMTYKVAKGGIEERISPNADGISAPMVEEVHYPMQTKGDANYIIGVTDGNPATINLILPIDATGAVFLSCGGATFSALVSAGQATLSISGIASGTYTFVAMYSGDEKYAPFSVSDTVTIS